MSLSALGAVLVEEAMRLAEAPRSTAIDRNARMLDPFDEPDDESVDRVPAAKNSAALYDRVSTHFLSRSHDVDETVSLYHNGCGAAMNAILDDLATLTYDELKALLPHLDTLPPPIER